MRSTQALGVILTIFLAVLSQYHISAAQVVFTQTGQETIESYDNAKKILTVSVAYNYQWPSGPTIRSFSVPPKEDLIGEVSFSPHACTMTSNARNIRCPGGITNFSISYRYKLDIHVEESKGEFTYLSRFERPFSPTNGTYDLFFPAFWAVPSVSPEPDEKELGHYQWVRQNTNSFVAQVRFRIKFKQEAAKLAAALTVDAALAGTVVFATAAIPEPVVSKLISIGASGVGVLTTLSAAFFKLIAMDPPDPNFTVISTPVISSFPMVGPDPNIPSNLRNAFNNLLSKLAQINGVAQAFLTALEREQGAALAGDTVWEERQRQAASRFASELSDLLNSLPALRATLQQAWKSAGFPDISITRTQVENFQKEVRINGLPTSLANTFAQIQQNTISLNEFKDIIISATPTAATFPQFMIDPKLITSIKNAAAAFKTPW